MAPVTEFKESQLQMYGGQLPPNMEMDQVEPPIPQAPPCSKCTFSWAVQMASSLDPAKTIDIRDKQIGTQMFEGLLNFSTDNRNPEPGVASYYSVSDDGLRYTFHLRNNAMWSNGSKVTARDFEYSWKRVLDQKTGAETAGEFFMIKNASAFYKGVVGPDELGIRVIDDYALEVTLEYPVPQFPRIVCGFAYAPVPRKVVEEYGDRWTRPENIVVNGPYKLVEYKLNARLKMEKNDDYWNSRTVQVKEINVTLTDSEDVQYNLYKTDKIDWATYIPRDVILQRNPDLHADTTSCIQGYVFNLSNPYLNDTSVQNALRVFRKLTGSPDPNPFYNPLVRRAFSMAIDREKLVREVLFLKEGVAESFIPKVYGQLQGYNSPDGFPEFNPAKARELLREAGYGDGGSFPEVEMLYSVSSVFKTVAEFIQAELQTNLGITVHPSSREMKSLIDLKEKGHFAMARDGFCPAYLDSAIMINRFSSRDPENYSQYSNSVFDQMMDGVLKTADQGARNALLARAEGTLFDDMPVIPLYFVSRTYLVKPYVTGFEPNLSEYRLVKNVRVP